MIMDFLINMAIFLLGFVLGGGLVMGYIILISSGGP